MRKAVILLILAAGLLCSTAFARAEELVALDLYPAQMDGQEAQPLDVEPSTEPVKHRLVFGDRFKFPEEFYRQFAETAHELSAQENASNLAYAGIKLLSPRLDDVWARELSGLIATEASDRKLDVLLVVALVFTESSFSPRALGPRIRYRGGLVRCMGLMQIHPCHGISNVMIPAVNVDAGCSILDRYCKSSGSLDGGLRRYGTSRALVYKHYNRLIGALGNG